jgi:hypothetical protein
VLRRMLLLAAGVTLVATACNANLYSGLGRQVAEFTFSASATQAMRAHALKACSGLPGTKAYRLPPKNSSLASQIYDVRFDVTHADNLQLQRLISCMTKQPGVQGVNIPDQSD